MVVDQLEFTNWPKRYSRLVRDYASCAGEHYFWLEPKALRGPSSSRASFGSRFSGLPTGILSCARVTSSTSRAPGHSCRKPETPTIQTCSIGSCVTSRPASNRAAVSGRRIATTEPNPRPLPICCQKVGPRLSADGLSPEP